MKRKSINAILADLEGNYNSQLWSEINQASQAVDVNLVVFEGRSIDSPGTDLQHNIIYNLAQKFPCDGYFLLSSQIVNFVGIPRVLEFCRPMTEKGVPVLSIGTPIPGTASFVVDNRTGMVELMDHLILHHGYRRIVFIKGPDMHQEAIERFAVYRESLQRNGIRYDERLVFPGDFSPGCGYRVLEEMVDAGVLPVDCIVCANDETAMGVYRCLRERTLAGASLPEFAVTGFDNTRNARVSRPGLTSVSQPFGQITLDAFQRLAAPDAKPTDEIITYPGKLVVRESCGCHTTEGFVFSDDLFIQATRNYRVHQIMQTFSLEELYLQISDVLAECGIGDCFIVKYAEPVVYPDQQSLPENAELIYANVDGRRKDFQAAVPFPTDCLLPEFCFPQDRRVTWIVKPLFFTNEHLGYMVFEPVGNDTRNYESVRGQISNTLKIALLLIRQNDIENKLANAVNELQEFNQKLNLLSVRDELSGLYNRRGFFEAASSLLGIREDPSTDSLIVYADIDGMKKINDTYGHAEGDEAIRATADILAKAFRGKDIIARMGGDEFVVLARTLTERHIPVVCDRIAHLVEEYNRTSGKEYRLDFSLGFSPVGCRVHLDLEELLKIADTRLYEEKRRKRGEAAK